MSKNTETAIVASNADITTQVINSFFNVDFEAVNKTIDALATRASLTETEKQEANKIIDSWNDNVIEKLRLEENKIRDFLVKINGSAHAGIPHCIEHQIYIDEIEALVDYAKIRHLYDEMCLTVDERTTAIAAKNNIPDIDDDINTTQGEYIHMMRDHEYAVTVAAKNVQKLDNKLARQNAEIVAALNADANVRSIITQLKKRVNGMTKMRTACTDKAQLAKINITIDDPNVRQSLKDLIALTKF